MLSTWRLAVVLSLAVGATLVSSVIPGKVHVVYPGSMDCVHGCDFLSGGWPFPYLVDHHGISPTGSVSLLGAILGVDIVWVGSLVATFAFWLAVSAAVVWIARRVQRKDRAA